MKNKVITVTLKDHWDVSHLNFNVLANDEDYIKPHDHDALEFACLEKGAVMHHFGDEVKRIEAGGYFFVDHGTVHWMERISDEPYRIINFLFRPDFIDRTLAGKQSFSDYLQQIRLEHACHLLETTNFTIDKIAKAVGINDIKYFHKIFKSHLGTTPGNFRKLYK